jgi:hypothetical protein
MMSTGSGGQSSSQSTVDTFQGQEDEEAKDAEDDAEEDTEEDEDRGYDELDESQLEGTPLTQPTQEAGTRRRRPPCKYTPGSRALRRTTRRH